MDDIAHRPIISAREKHMASRSPNGWLVSLCISITLIDITKPSIWKCKRLIFACFTSRGVQLLVAGALLVKYTSTSTKIRRCTFVTGTSAPRNVMAG